MKRAYRVAIPHVGNQLTRPGKLNTTCSRCGAIPGQRCRRWINALVGGKDIGGGYWRELVKPHQERGGTQ